MYWNWGGGYCDLGEARTDSYSNATADDRGGSVLAGKMSEIDGGITLTVHTRLVSSVSVSLRLSPLPYRSNSSTSLITTEKKQKCQRGTESGFWG